MQIIYQMRLQRILYQKVFMPILLGFGLVLLYRRIQKIEKKIKQ
jgi:hypothetical protein